MANEDHLRLLWQMAHLDDPRDDPWDVWNAWRDEHPDIVLDLSEVDFRRDRLLRRGLGDVDLRGANLAKSNLAGLDLRREDLAETDLREAVLTGADLRGAVLAEADLRGANLVRAKLAKANLAGADLTQADLTETDLSEAILRGAILTGASLGGANLSWAILVEADLSQAILTGANLGGANLGEAYFTGADLRRARLRRALLLNTHFEEANLTGCQVYGISAWDVHLARALQSDLIITPDGEPEITVDNLEVAQFIYLLLHNEKIREVIDTIGKKGVLILGRFAGERKAVLDALRTALRHRNYLPIVFDFEKPTQRDFTETIMTLAGLSLFVIADITNPRSAPLELQATVPDYMIPFVPIIAEGEPPFSMFIDLQRKFDWVLEVLTYDSIDHLIAGLQEAVIILALRTHEALIQRRARAVGTRHIQQYLSDGEARP